MPSPLTKVRRWLAFQAQVAAVLHAPGFGEGGERHLLPIGDGDISDEAGIVTASGGEPPTSPPPPETGGSVGMGVLVAAGVGVSVGGGVGEGVNVAVGWAAAVPVSWASTVCAAEVYTTSRLTCVGVGSLAVRLQAESASAKYQE